MSRIATIYLAFILGVLNHTTVIQTAHAEGNLYHAIIAGQKKERAEFNKIGLPVPALELMKKVRPKDVVKAGQVYVSLVKFSNHVDGLATANFGDADRETIKKILKTLTAGNAYETQVLQNFVGSLAASCESGISEPVAGLIFQALDEMQDDLMKAEKAKDKDLDESEFDSKMAIAFGRVFKGQYPESISEGTTHYKFLDIIKGSKNPNTVEATLNKFSGNKVNLPVDKLLLKTMLMSPDFKSRLPMTTEREKYRLKVAEQSCAAEYNSFLSTDYGVVYSSFTQDLEKIRKNHPNSDEFKKAVSRLLTALTGSSGGLNWGYPQIIDMLTNPLNPLRLSDAKITAIKSAMFDGVISKNPAIARKLSDSSKFDHKALDPIVALYTNQDPEKIQDLKNEVYADLQKRGLTVPEIDGMLKQSEWKLPKGASTEFVSTFNSVKPDTELSARRATLVKRLSAVEDKATAAIVLNNALALRKAAADETLTGNAKEKKLREISNAFITQLRQRNLPDRDDKAGKTIKGKKVSGDLVQLVFRALTEKEDGEESPFHPHTSDIQYAFHKEAASLALGTLTDNEKKLFETIEDGSAGVMTALRGGLSGISPPTSDSFKAAWERYLGKSSSNPAESEALIRKLLTEGYFPDAHAEKIKELLAARKPASSPTTGGKPPKAEPITSGKNSDFALPNRAANRAARTALADKEARKMVSDLRNNPPWEFKAEDFKDDRVTADDKKRILAESFPNHGKPGPGAWKDALDHLMYSVKNDQTGEIREGVRDLIKDGYFPPAQLLALKKHWPDLFKGLAPDAGKYTQTTTEGSGKPGKKQKEKKEKEVEEKTVTLSPLKPMPVIVKVGAGGEKKAEVSAKVWGLPSGVTRNEFVNNAVGKCNNCHSDGGSDVGHFKSDWDKLQFSYGPQSETQKLSVQKVNAMITGKAPKKLIDSPEAKLIRKMFGFGENDTSL